MIADVSWLPGHRPGTGPYTLRTRSPPRGVLRAHLPRIETRHYPPAEVARTQATVRSPGGGPPRAARGWWAVELRVTRQQVDVRRDLASV